MVPAAHDPRARICDSQMNPKWTVAIGEFRAAVETNRQTLTQIQQGTLSACYDAAQDAFLTPPHCPETLSEIDRKFVIQTWQASKVKRMLQKIFPDILSLDTQQVSDAAIADISPSQKEALELVGIFWKKVLQHPDQIASESLMKFLGKIERRALKPFAVKMESKPGRKEKEARLQQLVKETEALQASFSSECDVYQQTVQQIRNRAEQETKRRLLSIDLPALKQEFESLPALPPELNDHRSILLALIQMIEYQDLCYPSLNLIAFIEVHRQNPASNWDQKILLKSLLREVGLYIGIKFFWKPHEHLQELGMAITALKDEFQTLNKTPFPSIPPMPDYSESLDFAQKCYEAGGGTHFDKELRDYRTVCIPDLAPMLKAL